MEIVGQHSLELLKRYRGWHCKRIVLVIAYYSWLYLKISLVCIRWSDLRQLRLNWSSRAILKAHSWVRNSFVGLVEKIVVLVLIR